MLDMPCPVRGPSVCQDERRKRRVLVVDDNQDLAISCSWLLDSWGMRRRSPTTASGPWKSPGSSVPSRPARRRPAPHRRLRTRPAAPCRVRAGGPADPHGLRPGQRPEAGVRNLLRPPLHQADRLHDHRRPAGLILRGGTPCRGSPTRQSSRPWSWRSLRRNPGRPLQPIQPELRPIFHAGPPSNCRTCPASRSRSSATHASRSSSVTAPTSAPTRPKRAGSTAGRLRPGPL